VTATIGGAEARIVFAGAAPGFSGLLQLNVIVGELTGDALIVELKVGDGASQPGMVLVVR